MCTPVTNNESPSYLDVDGDGKRELLLGYDPGRFVGYAKPVGDWTTCGSSSPVSTSNAPGTDKFSHGIGVGDVNGDGRNDVLVTDGWWEAPADKGRSRLEVPPGQVRRGLCSHMYVYDFDGDGDNDVLCVQRPPAPASGGTSKRPTAGRRTTISDSFSQTHSLCLADINGDGLPDFVTGKRWWAHGPSGRRRAPTSRP